MKLDKLNEFSSGDWDYFGSYTLSGKDISIGDCYIELVRYVKKLYVLDNNIDGLFYVCKNSPTDRPHVHCVLKTDLPLRKVEKAWSASLRNKKVKRFDVSKSARLWLYIKLQSVGKVISVLDLIGDFHEKSANEA
jgi:hypothetical protein